MATSGVCLSPQSVYDVPTALQQTSGGCQSKPISHIASLSDGAEPDTTAGLVSAQEGKPKSTWLHLGTPILGRDPVIFGRFPHTRAPRQAHMIRVGPL